MAHQLKRHQYENFMVWWGSVRVVVEWIDRAEQAEARAQEMRSL